MKSYKTTIIGIGLAVMVAIQPIVEGTGYHFDSNTIGKLVFASLLAAFGYLTKDHDVTGKP
jgi:hypothetical protein